MIDGKAEILWRHQRQYFVLVRKERELHELYQTIFSLNLLKMLAIAGKCPDLTID
ncbi:MAG: hypothetical protein RMX96_03500 [Nostoc sp. ChiSLP02]|nr:hypothetical protein [Nostoc sp. DedSLP05]MDZ8097831.1 hypothetical protein [Nostoc sp. DedSLP01]MDZ8183916.1 hypothetical protein [Nostoc sp. ChiSLP02]